VRVLQTFSVYMESPEVLLLY